jgi:hypothetical protein
LDGLSGAATNIAGHKKKTTEELNSPANINSACLQPKRARKPAKGQR